MDTELTRWLETLTVTEGAHAGNPFRLLDWQKQFLAGAFADGIVTSALSISRGAGKSALLAAVASAVMLGPLAKPRSQVLIVAASLNQGRVIYRHMLWFLRSLGADLDKRKYWRMQDTPQQAVCENRMNGVTVQVLGSDPRKAHGLAPSLVLVDEPAQWSPGTAGRMIAALRTGLGKTPDGRMIALGTRSADKHHFFSLWLQGEADYVQQHSADPEADPFAFETWRQANPSLDHFPDLQKAIEAEASAARRNPDALASFQALRLNLGVADTTRPDLIDAELWQEMGSGEAPVRKGEYVLGLDLGSSQAMSAAAAYWPESGRLECFAAFADQPALSARGDADGVGDLYERMQRRDELLTLPGRVVPIPPFLAAAQRRFGEPARLVADRWRQHELQDGMEHEAVMMRCKVEWRGQGFKDGGEDVRLFRTACATGKVRPVASLLLDAAMAEAVTISDAAGNRKLAKSTEGHRRGNARDDAAAAAILAVSSGIRTPPTKALPPMMPFVVG